MLIALGSQIHVIPGRRCVQREGLARASGWVSTRLSPHANLSCRRHVGLGPYQDRLYETESCGIPQVSGARACWRTCGGKFSTQLDTPVSPSIQVSPTSKSCRVTLRALSRRIFVTDLVFFSGYAQFGKMTANSGSEETTTEGLEDKLIHLRWDFDLLLALVTTSGGVQRLLEEEFPDDALATAPPLPSTNHPNNAPEVSTSLSTACSTLLIIQ